jgi:dTDP-glucose pyrophosphorylase
MNFVIPMAGRGQRFTNAGYQLPKMLIEAHGKTLLEWSIDSLPLSLCKRLICILLKDHDEQFGLKQRIQLIYGNRVDVRFYELEAVTRGQAETVALAKSLVDPELDLLIFNIDTYFHSDTLVSQLLRTDIDGVLGTFKSTAPRFSFAVVDEASSYVTRTAEKEPISTHALTGLYHFKKPADFFEAADYYMQNNIQVNNEFYIAPMYNYLIEKGKKFVLDDAGEHHILGTPEELDSFLHQNIVRR